MNIELPDDFVLLTKRQAARDSWYDQLNSDDDVVVDDFAGGNVDDAYYGGFSDGAIHAARELLRFIDR